MFKGLSTLRRQEQDGQPKELSEKAKQLQAYLASKYVSGSATEQVKKKRKKKKAGDPAVGAAIKIVDEDVSGFVAPSAAPQRKLDSDEDDDEGPLIANPEEAERAKRLAQRAQQLQEQWEPIDTRPGAKRQRHDSPDVSPPRRPRHDSPDVSPPRRPRHDSPDVGPPRRPQRHDSEDISPPRRVRHDSPDVSPPRRPQRHDSEDISPPRKRQRSSSSDLSLPRRAKQESPDVHPIGRTEQGSDADISPPRRSTNQQKQASNGKAAAGVGDDGRARMADGRLGGIVSSSQLVNEVREKKEQERQRFAALGDDITGKGAKTVYRDREGRVVDATTAAEQGKKQKKKPREFEGEKDLAWGGGFAQKRAREERLQRMREEGAKPFARSRDDAELNATQRERERWGDPMAGLGKGRKGWDDAPQPTAVLKGKKAKKAGFIVPQEVPNHSWLRRNLAPAVNRYNIKPGRHWDGVDRSNGFENELFKTQNQRRAREQEEYAYAVMDM